MFPNLYWGKSCNFFWHCLCFDFYIQVILDLRLSIQQSLELTVALKEGIYDQVNHLKLQLLQCSLVLWSKFRCLAAHLHLQSQESFTSFPSSLSSPSLLGSWPPSWALPSSSSCCWPSMLLHALLGFTYGHSLAQSWSVATLKSPSPEHWTTTVLWNTVRRSEFKIRVKLFFVTTYVSSFSLIHMHAYTPTPPTHVLLN